jgi:hypothetical protein
MERLAAHATRSKGIKFTNQPGRGHTKVPATLRKLNSIGEWNFKPSGCRKSLPSETVIQDASYKTADDISDGVATAGISLSADDEEQEPYVRFLGETGSIRELFADAVFCGTCKRGKLELTFETKCLATSIHTRCKKCQTHSTSSTTHTGIP